VLAEARRQVLSAAAELGRELGDAEVSAARDQSPPSPVDVRRRQVGCLEPCAEHRLDQVEALLPAADLRQTALPAGARRSRLAERNRDRAEGVGVGVGYQLAREGKREGVGEGPVEAAQVGLELAAQLDIGLESASERVALPRREAHRP